MDAKNYHKLFLWLTILWMLNTAFGGIIFVVDTTSDNGDAVPGDGICDDGTGHATFRAALEEANALPGQDTIRFDIAGSGPHIFTPASGYPVITGKVVIDGGSEPDFADKPVIVLDGSLAGTSNGLTVTVGNCEIKRLVIINFHGNGIFLHGGSGNRLYGNFVGLEADGITAAGNDSVGIFLINSHSNMIGGSNGTDGNLVSSNHYDGISLQFSGCTGNSIVGNLVGTDYTGAIDRGNWEDGVEIYDGSENNIGESGTGAGNLISGNDDDGIDLGGTNCVANYIHGNFIGTDKTGMFRLGNSSDGIDVVSDSSFIGGYRQGEGNLISGNSDDGIDLSSGASKNVIQGNLIGVNIDGTSSLYNGNDGIVISDGHYNLIGGTVSGARNIISGNGDEGMDIELLSSHNIVQGNYVGLDITGSAAVGNQSDGIDLDGAPDNIIGGNTPEAQNIISGNLDDGLQLNSPETHGNVIQGNYFGLNPAGDMAVGNAYDGVFIETGAHDNLIGGGPGEGNVMSGNEDDGIDIEDALTSGNIIRGNYLGTDYTGTLGIGNAESGLEVENTPLNVLDSNLISGNMGNGVYLSGSSGVGNIFTANIIGLDISGSNAIGNSWDGFHITDNAHGNMIGGDTERDRNYISSNGEQGIEVNSGGNMIQGNYIGTTVDGMEGMGNDSAGIYIGPYISDTQIGGEMTEGNIIAHNLFGGVILDSLAGTGNAINGNQIYANQYFGIDLGFDGRTENDSADADGGPNLLQNFPEIIDADIQPGSGITIEYQIRSDTLNAPYPLKVEFYKADTMGQGAVLVGIDTYTKDNYSVGVKAVSFQNPDSLGITVGDVLVAIASDANGNTSEFSDYSGTITDIAENEAAKPNTFMLQQNYPNPFNPSTTISYSLPMGVHVELTIFDILGRKVKTLVNGYEESGIKKVRWDGRNEAGESMVSGQYFFRIQAGNFVRVRKMLFIK